MCTFISTMTRRCGRRQMRRRWGGRCGSCGLSGRKLQIESSSADWMVLRSSGGGGSGGNFGARAKDSEDGIAGDQTQDVRRAAIAGVGYDGHLVGGGL